MHGERPNKSERAEIVHNGIPDAVRRTQRVPSEPFIPSILFNVHRLKREHPSAMTTETAAETLRFASWNVNSLKVRLPQVLDWLEASRTDAVVLQETKLVDELFPREAIEAAGYDVVFTGQKTYNGVALLARREKFALAETVLNLPGYPDEQKRFVAATLTPKTAAGAAAPIRFCGAYVPNGMAVGSGKYLYKLDWLAQLERTMRAFLAETPNLILGGDFNIAPASRDLWDPVGWADGILCSGPEREAFASLLGAGLADSFRLFEQPEGAYSWWDYRQQGYERNHGLRIDCLLVSSALVPNVCAAAIDTAPRGNAQPSDHAPVTVDIALRRNVYAD